MEMIDTLQKVSASQAERLTFLSRWQEAYTRQLTDIPTFTVGDGSAIDGGLLKTGEVLPPNTMKDQLSDKEAKARTAVNQKMSALQEKSRARRGQISDYAKAMQSNLNQSQDNANQQTDIATAIIQQLSTILASIFR